MRFFYCLIPTLFLVGCTAVERADIYKDIGERLPEIPAGAVAGGPAGAIAALVTIGTAAVGGYVIRKFVQKKYNGKDH